jgi:hypothetical protein
LIFKGMESVLPTAITAASGLFIAVLTYRLGRKTEINKARLEKGWPLAQKIAVTMIELNQIETRLARSFQRNFANLTVDEGAAYFDRERDGLYKEEAGEIDQLVQKRRELAAASREARIYLNPDDLDRIEQYLAVGDFNWNTAPPFFSSFTAEFFRNLLDRKNIGRRARLFRRIKRRLNRIHEVRG